MTTPSTLNVPKTDQEWSFWSFANAQSVAEINAAILTQKNVNLPIYILDPINWIYITEWLQRLELSHEAFNSVLGLQSSDLESVDFNDEKQKISWIYLNHQELYSARQVLGI